MVNKHLKEQNLTYFEHWLTATKCGIALLIHAWFPFVLEDYASKRICKKKKSAKKLADEISFRLLATRNHEDYDWLIKLINDHNARK